MRLNIRNVQSHLQRHVSELDLFLQRIANHIDEFDAPHVSLYVGIYVSISTSVENMKRSIAEIQKVQDAKRIDSKRPARNPRGARRGIKKRPNLG